MQLAGSAESKAAHRQGMMDEGRRVAASSPLHDFLCRPVLYKLSINAQQQAPPRQLLRAQGLKVAGVPLHRGGLDGGPVAQGLEAVC